MLIHAIIESFKIDTVGGGSDDGSSIDGSGSSSGHLRVGAAGAASRDGAGDTSAASAAAAGNSIGGVTAGVTAFRFVAELVPRFTAGAFDFYAAPLPQKYADVVCGIGLSGAAINSLWPGCTTVGCVADLLGPSGFPTVARALLTAGPPPPAAAAIPTRLADAAEFWILQSLGVTQTNMATKGARARRTFLPHIIQRCVPAAFAST